MCIRLKKTIKLIHPEYRDSLLEVCYQLLVSGANYNGAKRNNPLPFRPPSISKMAVND
jgi:hypothetical protein